MNYDDTNSNIPDNMSTFEISNRDKKLEDGYTVKINVPKTACVINNEEEDISQRQNSHLNNPASNSAPRTFQTILKMVVGAVKRNLLSIDIEDGDEEDDSQRPTTRQRFPPWMIYSKRQNANTVSTWIQSKQERTR